MISVKDGVIEPLYTDSGDVNVVVFNFDTNEVLANKIHVVSTGILHNMIMNINQQIKEANNEL